MMSVGNISSFDTDRGIGTIRPVNLHAHGTGAMELLFHCIEIADGSRHIAEGTPVSYRLGLKLGRPEAFEITVLPRSDQ
jgi:cold shock CspA family protein